MESYGKRHPRGREEQREEQPKGALIQPVTTAGVWGLILLGTFGSWGGASSPIISRFELALLKAVPDAISFEAPELLEMVTRFRESTR